MFRLLATSCGGGRRASATVLDLPYFASATKSVQDAFLKNLSSHLFPVSALTYGQRHLEFSHWRLSHWQSGK